MSKEKRDITDNVIEIDKSSKCSMFDIDDVDPINAYFSKRCSKSNRSSIFKATQSDSDSSLGVLDIDNISELGDVEKDSNCNKNSLDIPVLLNEKNLNVNKEYVVGGGSNLMNNPLYFKSDKSEPSKSEMNLMKQRDLAKKTLMQLNSRLESITKNLKSLDIEKVEPVQKKAETEELILQLPLKEKIKNWFDYNQSPQTPRIFKDELNSLSESSSTTPVEWMKNLKRKPSIEENSVDDSTPIVKSKSNVLDSENGSLQTSDLIFESQNPDEVLQRFEEDEKKFIKEQSALSNNSEISHFSGVTGETWSLPWPPAAVEAQDVTENERISIGKYFEMRSHSINSLIGSGGSKETETDDTCVEESNATALIRAEDAGGPLKSDAPLTLEDDVRSCINKSKRWYSSCDLNGFSETASLRRHSNESSESTSTLLIQNLLRDMDSELSGTQISDRLLECLSKIKNEEKEKNLKMNVAENMDTPKSSKTGGKIRTLRSSAKGRFDCLERNLPTADVSTKSSHTSFGLSSTEFKENMQKTIQIRPKEDKKVLSLKNEHVRKGNIKGFDSSTPKVESLRSDVENFRSACSKVLIKDTDWEAPRMSSIRKPLNLDESLSAEESEKTLILNSTVLSSVMDKKSRATMGKHLNPVENSIAAGDLTILSERITEMQREDGFTVRPPPREKTDVLAVVQELVNYPKGSIDCSALTPLIRKQCPELLSAFSMQGDQSVVTDDSGVFRLQLNESVLPLPDSWVNFSSSHGHKDNIRIAVEVKKLISLPAKNLTKEWLIVSLESLSIQYQTEKYLNGSKVNDEFLVGDFLSVHMKDTLISPDDISACKIYLTPKVPVALHIRLKLRIKKLINKESRIQDLLLPVMCVFPQDNISVEPRNEINFGTIPQDCIEEKTVQITFDGICDLPLQVILDESEHFILSPDVKVEGESMRSDMVRDNKFSYNLKEGEKKVLQLKVKFQPHIAANCAKNAQMNLNGTLSIAFNASTKLCILRQVPILGCVGFAKFLCKPSYCPFIFRTTEIGLPVKRAFPLKNVGAIDIEFYMRVFCDDLNHEELDNLFSVPKAFVLPKGEERSFDVTFSAKTKDSYVKRYLVLQMQPSGQTFQVELIGIVMPVPSCKSLSRASSHSGPTQSVYNPRNIPFKLKSTTQAISWAAVALDVGVKQTFHIMNSSSCNAMARFSFKKETSSFKFINDNGEVIEKLRKVLKPNCSNIMTVVFRPDSIGPHCNSVIIETNHLSGRKMISLNGYGGAPKIFIRNLKSDLNGSKIIRLVNSEPESHIFRATLEFINKGNISGFVSINTMVKVLSLNNGLLIEPSNFIVLPNSRVEVQINQRLKNDEIRLILCGKDIGKVATVTVTTGDEPGRFRLRKLINEHGIKTSESISFLMSEFIGETNQDINKFEDDKLFETIFRKNIETIEIAAVIERPNDICEPTMLEDFEETVKEFVTILPANECSIASLREYESLDPSSTRIFSLEKSNMSASSSESSKSRDKKITKWLETLEKD